MIYEKVCNILSEQFDIEDSQITPDTDIAKNLNADSLDYVDLIMSLEDEFSLELPEERVEEFRTVGDIVQYIEKTV